MHTLIQIKVQPVYMKKRGSRQSVSCGLQPPFQQGMEKAVLDSLLIKFKRYRAVITAIDIRVNPCFPNSLLRILGNQEIVNPPPCILFTGFEPIAPPGINPLLLWIQISKGIDKAAFQQNTHLTAFLIREACISAVCLWIL